MQNAEHGQKPKGAELHIYHTATVLGLSGGWCARAETCFPFRFAVGGIVGGVKIYHW